MRSKYTNKNVDELLNLYKEAASSHGKGTIEGDYKKCNRNAKIVGSIYSELKIRGKDSQMMLLSLLEIDDIGVQLWVGAHALEFSPEVGKQYLVKLSKQSNLVGFSAEMTLKEWEKGRLKFP